MITSGNRSQQCAISSAKGDWQPENQCKEKKDEKGRVNLPHDLIKTGGIQHVKIKQYVIHGPPGPGVSPIHTLPFFEAFAFGSEELG